MVIGSLLARLTLKVCVCVCMWFSTVDAICNVSAKHQAFLNSSGPTEAPITI